MGIYRDDLESARLRIETLQAKLAASEADGAAQEAEVNELRRKVDRLERELGELQTDVPTLITGRPKRRTHAALAMVLVASCSLGFAAAYVSHRVGEHVQPPDPSTQTHPVTEPPHAPEPPSPAPVHEPPPPQPIRAPGEREPFDREAVRSALAAASTRAGACPSTVTGRGRILVTYEPDGRVTDVTVGPPFEASNAAPCILEAFRHATIPPFSGASVTVSKSFFIR